jgi:phosphocarrier protein
MERTVTVVPEAGLHARPASKFVRTANQFEADLRIAAADDDAVDARSMLSVTSLGVEQGEDVHLVAEGDDAGAALDALEAVLSTPESDENGETTSDEP